MSDNAQLTGLCDRFRGFYPVVIDVETAGFNAKTDALLEIAAITLKMDEQGAHRHIEKQAMDRCVSKKVVAEEIIKTYS